MLNVTQYHDVNDVTRIFHCFSNSWWQRGSLAGSKLSNFMWIPGLWFQKDLSQAVSWKKGWEPWREHSRLTCSLQKHILTQSSNLTAKFFQISSGSYGVLYYSKISEHKFQKFSKSASYNRSRVNNNNFICTQHNIIVINNISQQKYRWVLAAPNNHRASLARSIWNYMHGYSLNFTTD